ncbi:MAG TPA: glutamyl-tRNA reductase [Gemmatimonadaceae bacterium]
MALIVAGLSHHTAPIEVREQVAIAAHETPRVLEELARTTGASELALLSTCNRTELYVVEGDAAATPGIWAHLSHRLGGGTDAAAYGYVRRDREAAAHLYRVASGLDSMILGEAQIQGQVRDAWEASRSTSRAILNRLFQSSLLVASRVRTETAVGRGAASVSSAAVQLAKKIFGSLTGRRAMVLGAGDMAELALQCLVGEGVRTAIVANRTHERAVTLAERHGAQALRYDDCWPRLADVDVLLCSTASPHTIVARAQVEPAMRQRGDRPLCILDIALPRDVADDVGTLDNVFLYDLDDLRSVVATNLERRRQDLPTAESVIAEEVELYWQWVAGLAAVPVLRTFRSQMNQVREDELARALKKLAHLAPDDRAAVDLFSRALMNKFLHEPSVRLRAASANGHGLAIVDALRYLFALEPADGDAQPEDVPESESR